MTTSTGLDATDPRLLPPDWDASGGGDLAAQRRRLLLLGLLNAAAAVWYVGWLLQPGRAGQPLLYGMLLAAELFNLAQAAGFWWTCAAQRPVRPPDPAAADRWSVDVLIPTYNEPVAIVAPTVAAARRIRGADVRVWVLDDGDRDEVAVMAARLGAGYLRRRGGHGAKAGNLNAALARTHGDLVAVFDCDHVPDPAFLEATAGHFADPAVALVQTPQYYANHDAGAVAAAAWSQQALFFGPIARGKDALGATFCCGTNMLLRRAALEEAGGFPTDSITEDFALSVGLHERGWTSRYVPRVLARGLGPEDMAAYVGQQQRWAQGCLGALRTVLTARLPLRLKAQYLLSAVFFASGWTVAVYLALPLVAILTGAIPISGEAADTYLLHFVPYWALAVGTVAVAGRGTYTFRAFAVLAATWWIHVHACLRVASGRVGGFVVTPKEGADGPQPRAVAPTLAVAAALAVAGAYGLLRDLDPSTVNNVAFAGVHLSVQLAGAAPALLGPRRREVAPAEQPPALRRAA